VSDQYKKGDALVRFGRVYQIFKIKDKKVKGEKQPVLFYKRVFPGRAGNVTCSIPAANLNKIETRRPHLKKDFTEFFKVLKKTTLSEDEDLKINGIKNPQNLDFSDQAILIKKLWLEKKDPAIKTSFSKKNLLSSLLRSVKEELAYVYQLDLDAAQEKIESMLNS